MDSIVLHHLAISSRDYDGERSILTLAKQHVTQRRFSDIGYHYIIAPDGRIWLGRPPGVSGAHTKKHNARSVGVALFMNGEEESPKAKQAIATAQLLHSLLERFHLDASRDLKLHREFYESSCPGQHVTKERVFAWLSELEAR